MLPKFFCASLLGIILVGLCLQPLIGQTKQEKEVLKLVAQANSLSESRNKGADALKVAKDALRLAKEIPYDLGVAKASYEITKAYYDLGESGDSIEHYANQALSIAQELKDTALQGDVHVQFGRLYKHYELFVDAARSYEQALNFRLQGKDALKIATVYSNLSSVYLEFGQVWDACTNAKLAIEYWPKSNPTSKAWGYLASFYINYSNALGATGDLDSIKKAINYSWEAIKIAQSKPDEDLTLFEAYYGLGKRYYEKKYYSRAISTFKRILAKSQNYTDSVMTLEALAMSYLSLKKLDVALRYINEAAQMARDSQDTASLVNIYINKGDILSTLGEYKASNEILEEAKKMLPNSGVKDINEIKSRLEINIEKHNHSLTQQTKNLFLILGLIALLISIVIISIFRLKASNAKAEKAETEKLAALALAESETLKAEVLEIEQEFESLVHIQIHNNLNDIKTRILIALRDGVEPNIDEIIERIDEILEQFRNRKVQELEVNLFAEYLSRIAKRRIIPNLITLEIIRDINEGLGNIVKDEICKNLGSIVNLAFSNIQGSSKATLATFTIDTNSKELFVEIKDNGIGFNPGEIDKKSRGLKDMEAKAQEVGGNFIIDSVKGAGTTVRVIVPNPYRE